MPTPTVITDLDPVAANNFPAGSNAPSVLDDVQRAHGAFIRQLLNATQSQAYTAFTTSGTSTAYTLTPTPAITAYAAGQSFDVKFHAECGAAPTLEISGVATPPNLVKRGGDGTVANVVAGDIPAGTYRVRLLSATQAEVLGLWRTSAVNGIPLLHLNDIINGDFRIAQAGTSFAAPASGAYDLDGWFNSTVSTAVYTVAQAAGSTAGRLARQVTITTADTAVAAGDHVIDGTRIEGFNIEKYVGKTFTVGFRAKVPVAGIHCVALRNSGNDRSYIKEINFPTAGVHQDCSFTVVGGLPTAGTWNYTNGKGLEFSFAHMCGTDFQTTPDAWQTGNFLGTANQVNDCATVDNVWALEKVTLNLGTVAAVSEISFDQELARCQRYAQPVTYGINGYATASGQQWGGTVRYPVSMRASPSVPASAFTNAGAGATTVDNVTASGFRFYASSSGAGGIDCGYSGLLVARL